MAPERRAAEAPGWLSRSAAVSWRLLVVAAAIGVVGFLLVYLRLVVLPVIVALCLSTMLAPPEGCSGTAPRSPAAPPAAGTPAGSRPPRWRRPPPAAASSPPRTATTIPGPRPPGAQAPYEHSVGVKIPDLRLGREPGLPAVGPTRACPRSLPAGRGRCLRLSALHR